MPLAHYGIKILRAVFACGDYKFIHGQKFRNSRFDVRCGVTGQLINQLTSNPVKILTTAFYTKIG